MKFLYSILAVLFIGSNVVCSQSIFRGKTMKCEDFGGQGMNIVSYVVDNNDNAKMTVVVSQSDFSYEAQYVGVDKSTNRLFYFQHDPKRSKITYVKINNIGIQINHDRTITIEDKKYTRSELSKKGFTEQQLNLLMEGYDRVKKQFIDNWPMMVVQISRLSDDEFIYIKKKELNWVQYDSFKFVK